MRCARAGLVGGLASMTAAVMAAAMVAALAGCGGTGDHLFVEVRTDLRPLVEFNTVRVALDGRGPQMLSVRDGDFLTGERVAELADVPDGRRLLEVTLLLNGVEVVGRRVSVSKRGRLIVLVVLTRDCRRVRCPGSGDDPAETECLAGRCVEPDCSSFSDGTCGAADCALDEDCAVPPDCTGARCTDGVCLELDCAVTIPEPVVDAGSVDAGPGGIDGGTGGVDAGMMSLPDTGPVIVPDAGPMGPCVGRMGEVCRGVAGPCDVEERCVDGLLDCPPDDFAPSSQVCDRSLSGPCDAEDFCTGSSASCPESFLAAGTTCGPAGGPCNPADTCNGASAECEASVSPDGAYCNQRCGEEMCMGGTCVGGRTCGAGERCGCDEFCVCSTCACL